MKADGGRMKKQLLVFAILLIVYALLVFATVVWELEQLTAGQPLSPQFAAMPRWLLGLVNAALILVVYGVLGLIGLWFARKLGLPGIYRANGKWRDWFWLPLAIGIVVGIAMVIGDRALATIGNWRGFPHPPFPLSILASGSAGIGEEIMFRMFVLGLWAFLLNLILRHWRATKVALWIANVIAALACAAGHLPAAMMLLGVTTPDALPPVALVELFLLNGIVAIVAGERYIRDGLVAAAGVHFWADVVWHVIFPLIGV